MSLSYCFASISLEALDAGRIRRLNLTVYPSPSEGLKGGLKGRLQGRLQGGFQGGFNGASRGLTFLKASESTKGA